MSILLDHCVPHHYLRLLHDWGYEVHLLKEQADPRSPDPDVLRVASKLDAVLVTVDTDFQNILQYPPQNYQGIVVIQNEQRAQKAIAAVFKQALQELYRDKLRGVLVIIEAEGYRIRSE